METEVKVFGDKAKDLAKSLGLEKSGDTTDINGKVWFEYKSVEGHPVVEILFHT